MSIFEKSVTWWGSESGVPGTCGYKKCRNERFRPKAFQKIKNYQNRPGENFSVTRQSLEFFVFFRKSRIFVIDLSGSGGFLSATKKKLDF